MSYSKELRYYCHYKNYKKYLLTDFGKVELLITFPIDKGIFWEVCLSGDKEQFKWHYIIENEVQADWAEKLIEEFALAFKGLTEFEILNLLALSYADDGDLTRKDLRLIFDQKQQMIKKAGILEMNPLKETIDDIGGLENLKAWFIKKAKVYKNMNNAKKYGVDMPKGVLIAGVPGCGKSLNAKAAANLFEVPLLRLDMGRLMGKYVGESEGNLRSAIALAEAISPCAPSAPGRTRRAIRACS